MEDLVAGLVGANGLWAIAVLMLVNGIFSVPPSELVLCLAGVLAQSRDEEVIYYVLSGTVGNLLGALTLYGLGRSLSETRISDWRRRIKSGHSWYSWFYRVLPSDALVISCRERVRRGRLVWLCYLRCVPVVRSVISIPAGSLKVNVLPFCLLTFLGCLCWAGFWICGGYVLGMQILVYGKGLTFAVIVILSTGTSFAIYRAYKLKAALLEEEKHRD